MAENANAASPEQAWDVLMGNVYVPAFLEKLASRGIPINTEEDLAHALKIAANLNYVDALASQNEVQETTGTLKIASEALQGFMVEQGVPLPPGQENPSADAIGTALNEEAVQKAASTLTAALKKDTN